MSKTDVKNKNAKNMIFKNKNVKNRQEKTKLDTLHYERIRTPVMKITVYSRNFK